MRVEYPHDPPINVHDCSVRVTQDVAAYWAQKLPHIQELLADLPKDIWKIRLSYTCRDTGESARAILLTPTATLIARTDRPAPDYRTAVDQVMEKLSRKIRRHQEELQRAGALSRSQRRQNDFAAAEADIRAIHDEADRPAFFDVLRPLLRELRDHAGHELRLANLEGAIPPGELTVDDLIDDLIVRAWDHWNDRPKDQPLDRWLLDMLHRLFHERGFHPPDDPEDQSTNPWQDDPYAADRAIIEDELNRASADDRRAFLLSKQGADVADIAAVQNRPLEEVQRVIDALGASIRERMQKELAR